jgi:hypothetical protein
MVRRVCFYHAACPDGFGAAWAVRGAWGAEGQYLPRGHDDEMRLGELRGATVAFVDLAPGNAQLRALASVAERVIVLDHHVSSRDRFAADPALGAELSRAGHLVRFDLSRSGATLAWTHFHGEAQVPELLAYVEDQDLWRFALPRSREVNVAIASHPQRFEVWDRLAATPAAELAAEGAPILRAQRAEVERAIAAAHPIWIGDLRVEAVNTPVHRAAIGHELAERKAYGVPAGAVYRLSGQRVDVSVYAVGDLDVAGIAVRYGGGGHRSAAGFTVPLETWLRDFA